MYNNGFPQGYSYYQNQAPPMQLVQAQMPPAQNNTTDNGIIWVQGEAGARAYLVPAGKSAMLMDSENSVFYIKTTDSSGVPNALRIFDYKERIQQQTPKNDVAAIEQQSINNSQEYEELEKQIEVLNQKIKELEEQLLEVATAPSSNKKGGGK